MIKTLYIERQVIAHPRTRAISERFPHARQIICERYGEVFNGKSQNFRLQKNQPALILAAKHGKTVLPTPPGYGIGGRHNYYFSHMLNCVYDCRYCFLQGMYHSAHYVLFVNYEDFFSGIENTQSLHTSEPAWFFSGYDCDSLALEPITGFVDSALDFFRQNPGACLELRTKSTQIRSLLKRGALKNCVVAYSLNPEIIVRALEHKTPSLAKRIEAMATLQKKGWPIGLRFDPVVYDDNFRKIYSDMFAQIFARLNPATIHSISLGAFRLPKSFFHKIVTLYPREKLFAAKVDVSNKSVRYHADLEKELLDFCRTEILKYVTDDCLFFTCGTDDEAA